MSDLLQLVVKTADQHLAEQIEVLDFRGHSALCDYFVICSASNERLASSIMDYVVDEAEKEGYPVRNVEAQQGSRWILVDLYDVILHIFTPEERALYQLEKLWGDLPRIEVR